MRCETVVTFDREFISCDRISPVGDHMPGFYSIWREGKRVAIINGAHIMEIYGCESDPDDNPMVII